MQRRLMFFLGLCVALLLAACGAGLATDGESGIDLDSVLADLRDCDVLSDTFVAVVREAADDLDSLAEATGGRVPAGELAARVDDLTGNAYFEIAEQLGCNMVAQRLDTIERLRDLNPDTDAGDDLVTDVIRQLEESQG